MSLYQRSAARLGQMWQQGIDILEYQDATLIRERAVLGQYPDGLRYAAGFVLVAGVLNALFALVAGILEGAAIETVVRSAASFLLTFLLHTGVTFLAGRVLGGRAALTPFVYVTALYAVPLQVIEGLLTVASSLVPVVGFYLLVLLTFGMAALRLYLSYLVTQATMQLPRPWQRGVLVGVLLLLALIKGGVLILG